MAASPWYVLEVVRHYKETQTDGLNEWEEEHVGYMNAAFKTKKDASSYYKRYNPHMRAIDATGSDCEYSDWDPETNLRYIIRKYHLGIKTVIPPFDLKDLPKKKKDGSWEHKYLK